MTNAPAPFPGTEEQKRANYWSHHWVSFDPEEAPRCMDCDCNSWGVVKDWPCGTEPPRVETRTTTRFDLRDAVWAKA